MTLPLDGRNFIPLIALAPGVMLPPASTLPRINGSRPRVSEYIYDGISVLQPEPGQVAYFPVVDAIEEFRVETNSYSAEYGRSNGGVIMVNHKSGSNEFHGTLFEFFRNEALNARNLFATTGPKASLSAQPVRIRFRRTNSAEQDVLLCRLPGHAASSRHSADEHGSDDSPATGYLRHTHLRSLNDTADGSGFVRDRFLNDTIPLNRVDPAARRLLNRYPFPNVFVNGQEAASNNYVRVANETTDQDQFGVRVDHNLNANHRIFGRYAFLRDDSRPSTPLPDGSGVSRRVLSGDTLTRADSIAAEHSWTLSANKVNQLRFGYTRRGFDRNSLRTGRPASQVTGIPNIPASAFSDTLPTYDVVGFQQLGPTANGNAEFTTSVTQIVNNFSWLRGRHSMKLGGDWRIEHLNILQPPSPTGSFQFTNILTSSLSAAGTPVAGTGNSFASFLLGQVQTFPIDVQRRICGLVHRLPSFSFRMTSRQAPG